MKKASSTKGRRPAAMRAIIGLAALLTAGLIVSPAWASARETSSTTASVGVAAMPVLPHGMHYADTVRVLSAPTKLVLSPDDSSGCNPFTTPHTCIYLTGSGLTLDDWATSSDITANCGQAFFEVNGAVRGYSEQTCEGPGYYFSDGGRWLFGYTSKVCNFWHGGRGLPCETVHS